MTEPDKKAILRLLRRAYQVFLTNGGIQGQLRESVTGKVCALGALGIALGNRFTDDGTRWELVPNIALFDAAIDELDRTVGFLNSKMGIVSFNDKYGYENAKEIYRATIESLEMDLSEKDLEDAY